MRQQKIVIVERDWVNAEGLEILQSHTHLNYLSAASFRSSYLLNVLFDPTIPMVGRPLRLAGYPTIDRAKATSDNIIVV